MVNIIKTMSLKTLLYQVVMSFFGFMLYSALKSNPFLKMCALIVSILFYWYILFSQSMDIGTKIAEKDISHKTESPLYGGFIASFIALIPTLVLSIVSVISKPSLQGAGYVSFLINKLLLQGMNIGICQYIFPTSTDFSQAVNNAAMDSQSIVFLVSIAPSVLICGVAFLIGYKRFSPKSR